MSRTWTAEIVRWDTEITNLPPHRGAASSHWCSPNTPLSLLIQILFLLPLNTSRNSSPEALHVRFFHANCYQSHQELYQPSQGVSAWPQFWTEQFFSPETQAAGLWGRRQAAPAPAWYTPCMALSSPSFWTAGTKPSCFHSWPSAGSFPKNQPPFLLLIMESQSSQQHWSGCFSVLGSEQRSEQFLKTGILG